MRKSDWQWISFLRVVFRLNQRKLKHLTHFTLRGHEISPVKHLYLKVTALDRSQKVEVLGKFVDKVWWVAIVAVTVRFLSLSNLWFFAFVRIPVYCTEFGHCKCNLFGLVGKDMPGAEPTCDLQSAVDRWRHSVCFRYHWDRFIWVSIIILNLILK